MPTISGKHALVLGRSRLVGKPAAHLLLAQNCTVTIAHSRSENLPDLCRNAEILIAAAGVPHLVQGNWIAEGAVVIDVGITRQNGKLLGDVDTAAALPRAAFITPVPGGVGPMTIACLLRNTVAAAKSRGW